MGMPYPNPFSQINYPVLRVIHFKGSSNFEVRQMRFIKPQTSTS
jgi:hypothetical protein